MNRVNSSHSYVWCRTKDLGEETGMNPFSCLSVDYELESRHFFREHFTPPSTPEAEAVSKRGLLGFDFSGCHRRNREEAEEKAFQDGLDLGCWRDREKMEADEIRRTVSDAMDYFIREHESIQSRDQGGSSVRTGLDVLSPQSLLMQVAFAYQAEELLECATEEEWIKDNWDKEYYFEEEYEATGTLKEKGYGLVWKSRDRGSEFSFIMETGENPPVRMIKGAMDSILKKIIWRSYERFTGDSSIVVFSGRAAEGITVYRRIVEGSWEEHDTGWKETKVEDGSPHAWELSMGALSASGSPLFGHMAGEYVRQADGTYSLSRYALGIAVSVSTLEKAEFRRGRKIEEGYLLDYGLPEGREEEVIQEERRWIEKIVEPYKGKRKVSWSAELEIGELGYRDDVEVTITYRISGLTEKNTRAVAEELRQRGFANDVVLFSLLTGEEERWER